MRNLWSEQEASGLSALDLLVYQSRLVGGEPSLALWGGGNTSLKTTERDFLGVERAIMRIKGSGADMRTIGRGGFPGVLLEHVLPLLERDEMPDDEMVDYLSRCLLEPGSPRPSIETLLHAFLPQASVVHSHADAILSITNTRTPHDLLEEAFGAEVAVVGYRRPGFTLSKEVALSAQGGAAVRGVALLNHGLVTWGDTPREAYETHIELVTRAEDFVRRAAGVRRPFRRAASARQTPFLRRQAAAALAPTLRGLLVRRGGVLRFEDGDDVMRLVRSPDAEALTAVGAATPDHLLTTKRAPLFVDAGDLRDAELARARLTASVEAYAGLYREWYVRHTDGAHPMLDPYPRVALLRGVGMWTAGADGRAGPGRCGHLPPHHRYHGWVAGARPVRVVVPPARIRCRVLAARAIQADACAAGARAVRPRGACDGRGKRHREGDRSALCGRGRPRSGHGRAGGGSALGGARDSR